MQIDMGDSEPVSQRPYPITMNHCDWVRSEISKFLGTQVIHSSHSSWPEPIIVVPKGDGGKFLGPFGYYCNFIKNSGHIAKLLTALTHHDVKLIWTSSHLTAFNTLKSPLPEAPILYYPDPSKHYIVYTDASDDACGTQLS